MPPDYIDQLKREYPARLGHQGWEKVRVLAPRLCFTWNIPWETLLLGTKNYKRMNDQMGKTGSEFVMPAAKFFDDRDKLVLEYAEMDMRTPQEIQEGAKWSQLEVRARAVNASLDRSKGYDWAQEIVQKAEREALNKRWEASGMNAPKFAVVK